MAVWLICFKHERTRLNNDFRLFCIERWTQTEKNFELINCFFNDEKNFEINIMDSFLADWKRNANIFVLRTLHAPTRNKTLKNNA